MWRVVFVGGAAGERSVRTPHHHGLAPLQHHVTGQEIGQAQRTLIFICIGLFIGEDRQHAKDQQGKNEGC